MRLGQARDAGDQHAVEQARVVFQHAVEFPQRIQRGREVEVAAQIVRNGRIVLVHQYHGGCSVKFTEGLQQDRQDVAGRVVRQGSFPVSVPGHAAACPQVHLVHHLALQVMMHACGVGRRAPGHVQPYGRPPAVGAVPVGAVQAGPQPVGAGPTLVPSGNRGCMGIQMDSALRRDPLEPGLQCGQQQALAEAARAHQKLVRVGQLGHDAGHGRRHRSQQIPEADRLVDVQPSVSANPGEVRQAGVQRGIVAHGWFRCHHYGVHCTA